MTYSWLVENFTKDGKSTGLYMACQVNMTVTADVNAARKFRRQITAEFRALDMREARRGDWRAVEHGFDDSEPPNTRRRWRLTRLDTVALRWSAVMPSGVTTTGPQSLPQALWLLRCHGGAGIRPHLL